MTKPEEQEFRPPVGGLHGGGPGHGGPGHGGPGHGGHGYGWPRLQGMAGYHALWIWRTDQFAALGSGPILICESALLSISISADTISLPLLPCLIIPDLSRPIYKRNCQVAFKHKQINFQSRKFLLFLCSAKNDFYY